MKIWIILLYTTLVLFSAVLPSCYAASPLVLLVIVGQPSVPSPARFPSPELLLGIIKQWDQLPSLFGLNAPFFQLLVVLRAFLSEVVSHSPYRWFNGAVNVILHSHCSGLWREIYAVQYSDY